MRLILVAVLAAIATTACTSGGVAQQSAPPVSRSPSGGWPANTQMAIYDSPAPNGAGHIVSVVRIKGSGPNESARVIASAHVAYRTPSSGPAVIDIPYVSTSKKTIYILDGDSNVLALAPDGSLKKVASIPGSNTVRAAFAVSPDDAYIAVGAWAVTPVWTSTVYVEKIGGRGHVDLLPWKTGQTAAWPVGWHAGKIILAIGGSLLDWPTYPPARNQYSAGGYEQIDPVAGGHVSDVGAADCVVTGLLTSAGTACVASPDGPCLGGMVGEAIFPHNFNSCLRRYDWAGHETLFLLPKELKLFAFYAALSPEGRAMVTDQLDRVLAPVATARPGKFFVAPRALQQSSRGMGWIDSRHFSMMFLKADGTYQHIFTVNTDYSSVVELPMESLVAGPLVATLPGGL